MNIPAPAQAPGKLRRLAIAFAAIGAVSACATVAPPGPVEVTRFHQAETLTQIGSGVVFIETAPGDEDISLQLAPYKEAIARELIALGYREGARSEATAIAQISLDSFKTSAEREKRGPVSVGVGGSTGSYGSGVGLGIGINLGGGGSSAARIGTELSVALRPIGGQGASSSNLWEGRAQIEVSEGTPEAAHSSLAPVLAQALFRDFPGGNVDTVSIDASELQPSE